MKGEVWLRFYHIIQKENDRSNKRIDNSSCKNTYGNVVALYNSNGNLHARYEYDAWGKLLSIKNANGVDITNTGNFAIVNPFRYRGYYYDTESRLYYLQSRYYDPTTGRFVNADVIAYSTNDSFVGMNLYAYAKNNYISCIDSNGYFVITLFKLAIVAVATVATVATASVVITIVNSPSFQTAWKRFWESIVFAKPSKQSAKSRATNAPSWLGGAMGSMPPHRNERAQEYAKRLLDYKYGKGKWKKGADTEYNKIVKYLQRNLNMR